MKKIYKISGNYTPEEKEVLTKYIDMFRMRVADDDPEKNILNKKAYQYSDDTIVKLIMQSLSDINSGFPRTTYSLIYFDRNIDDNLIVDGAIVFALIREGILQMRNQIDYSDSGLSIAMFNKTSLYQGWASFLMQKYLQDKKDVKRAAMAKMPNAGFLGIGSEFGYDGW
ncbi:MAG: hypothetical protein N2749_00705 [Clostridia bacterium]|nr:hypothetical protein [Clostridia bacterium]